MKKHNCTQPKEAPIITAQNTQLTVKRDDAGRLYTYRRVDPDKHVMQYDNSVNYCDQALDEASKRGIEYHRIDVKGEGPMYVSHDTLLKEGRSPRYGTYAQKGLPLHRWTVGTAPTPAQLSDDQSEQPEEPGE